MTIRGRYFRCLGVAVLLPKLAFEHVRRSCSETILETTLHPQNIWITKVYATVCLCCLTLYIKCFKQKSILDNIAKLITLLTNQLNGLNVFHYVHYYLSLGGFFAQVIWCTWHDEKLQSMSTLARTFITMRSLSYYLKTYDIINPFFNKEILWVTCHQSRGLLPREVKMQVRFILINGFITCNS